MPKAAVLDPQGSAVLDAIRHMSEAEHKNSIVKGVRIGKFLELEVDDGMDRSTLKEQLDTLCRDLFSNGVIEDYRLELGA